MLNFKNIWLLALGLALGSPAFGGKNNNLMPSQGSSVPGATKAIVKPTANVAPQPLRVQRPQPMANNLGTGEEPDAEQPMATTGNGNPPPPAPGSGAIARAQLPSIALNANPAANACRDDLLSQLKNPLCQDFFYPKFITLTTEIRCAVDLIQKCINEQDPTFYKEFLEAMMRDDSIFLRKMRVDMNNKELFGKGFENTFIFWVIFYLAQDPNQNKDILDFLLGKKAVDTFQLKDKVINNQERRLGWLKEYLLKAELIECLIQWMRAYPLGGNLQREWNALVSVEQTGVFQLPELFEERRQAAAAAKAARLIPSADDIAAYDNWRSQQRQAKEAERQAKEAQKIQEEARRVEALRNAIAEPWNNIIALINDFFENEFLDTNDIYDFFQHFVFNLNEQMYLTPRQQDFNDDPIVELQPPNESGIFYLNAFPNDVAEVLARNHFTHEQAQDILNKIVNGVGSIVDKMLTGAPCDNMETAIEEDSETELDTPNESSESDSGSDGEDNEDFYNALYASVAPSSAGETKNEDPENEDSEQELVIDEEESESESDDADFVKNLNAAFSAPSTATRTPSPTATPMPTMSPTPQRLNGTMPCPVGGQRVDAVQPSADDDAPNGGGLTESLLKFVVSFPWSQ
jgi:hypothetical protein